MTKIKKEKNTTIVSDLSPQSPLTPTLPSVTVAKSLNLPIGILIGIVLTLAVIFAVKLFANSSDSPFPFPTPTISQIIPTPTLSFSHPTSTPVPKFPTTSLSPGDLTYLSVAQKKTLDVLVPEPQTNKNDTPCFDVKNASFFLVGNYSSGAKLYHLYLAFNCEMGGGNNLYRLIVDNDGKTYLPIEDLEEYPETTSVLKPSVLFTDYQPDLIDIPEVLNTKVGVFKNIYSHGSITPEEFNRLDSRLVEVTSVGTIYATYKSDNKIGLYNRVFYLKLKDLSFVSLWGNYETYFKTDNQVPQITWHDNTVNIDQYQPEYQEYTGGCGGNSFNVIKAASPLISNKVNAGVTNNNEPVYQIIDPQSPFIKELYGNYAKVYNRANSEAPITLSDFVRQKSHFIYQDALGDWQIFINSKYGYFGECAKPVIYLYPPKETPVTVKVAANITQSEPKYPAAGWTVLAKPSGELIYSGQSYPYLFWEGKGLGEYPNYQNRGVVVTQKDLVATLYSQLSQLGLNEKESADFMDFWTAKLPTTPYVRLTWLTTDDMNKLAPLSVNPRPDTAIRIFLEFEGLDEPVSLTPQTLSAPPRQGFTLVEWGGLLEK
ncbi:MAG: hypothetical protein WC686_01280 [Candidatus Shapirobacteria bacterium]|jgi:hypothetical protein